MSHICEMPCPYCGDVNEVDIEGVVAEQPRKLLCAACHKPILLYATEGEAVAHTDRSIAAVSVEEIAFDKTRFYIEVIANQFGAKQLMQIPEGRHILGRFNPKSRASLQVVTNDPSMDRNHSILRLSKKGILDIEDNDSMTGTFLNGLEILPGDRRRLHEGDVLTLGATSIIIHLPERK